MDFSKPRKHKMDIDDYINSISVDEHITKRDLYRALRKVYDKRFVQLLKTVIDSVPINFVRIGDP